MRKIMNFYIAVIMTITATMLMVVNYAVQLNLAEKGVYETAVTELNRIADKVEANKEALAELQDTLAEDYLTRAKMFRYVIEQNPEILNSQSELQRVKFLLNVDELHVIDDNGVIIAGTIPQYIGMDFHTTEQTKEFLKILEDPTYELVQDVQPNGAEQKIFQYIGVARRDAPGIVQVGLSPTRLLEARSRNNLGNIYQDIQEEHNARIFAADTETGEILAHVDESKAGKNMKDFGFTGQYYETFKDGAFLEAEGKDTYFVMKKYDNMILGYGQEKKVLLERIYTNMLITMLSILSCFIFVIFILNYILKKNIVSGIHQMIDALSDITEGKLDTVLKVGGNPEFEKLSGSINEMVGSLVDNNAKITQILDASSVEIGIYEYKSSRKGSVMATQHVQHILSFTPEEAAELYKDAGLFTARLREIMRVEDGAEGVYKIAGTPDKWVKIHQVKEKRGSFGIVTDVTKDMLEKQRMLFKLNYDELTKLYNRVAFEREAGARLEAHDFETAAVIMFDMDYFKRENDQYGHDWGDIYLQIAASKFKEMCGDKGIVARRSGDEFLAFIDKAETQEEIRAMLQKFYDGLAANPIIPPDNVPRKMGVSSGIAWYTPDTSDINELIQKADRALYEAKEAGRGVMREL